ncbi:unnamed protein product [Caenorhabditis brenneri]
MDSSLLSSQSNEWTVRSNAYLQRRMDPDVRKLLQIAGQHMIFTFDQGVEKCKKEGGEIAYIHHRYIIGVWRGIFRGAGQIWVNASESFEQYVQKTKTVDGDKLALAFDGKHCDFSVMYNSLIKVSLGKGENRFKCATPPPLSVEASDECRGDQLLGKKILRNHGVLTRSASSYTRSTPNLNVCRGALQPFMPGSVETFIMDANELEGMDTHKSEFTHMTRSGAVNPFDQSKMSDAMCNVGSPHLQVELHADFEKKTKATNPFLDAFKDKMTCDNMQSTTQAEMKMMSDSRSLPIWCKLGRSIKMTYVVPEGYKAFVRASGEAIGHRLFPEQARKH